MRRSWIIFGLVAASFTVAVSAFARALATSPDRHAPRRNRTDFDRRGVARVAGRELAALLNDDPADAFIKQTLREESRRKLKQIGLALHNFHQEHNHFPQAALPNAALKPEKRLSWEAALLPFLDQRALYDQLALDKAWDDAANRKAVATPVDGFFSPAVEKRSEAGAALTHYVGLAGLGPDGPTLPVTDPKAGCFAYNRATKIADIKDGTSNTIMVSEAVKDYGPWAAGGRATIRAVTKEPAINGPDGLGGLTDNVCVTLMADGSVLMVSNHIDSKTYKALVTINGREGINLNKRRR